MQYAPATISLSHYCPICGCSGGYRVLSSEGRWVHKRCALLLASTIASTVPPAQRTLVEFVLRGR